jgi:hypothetical protein
VEVLVSVTEGMLVAVVVAVTVGVALGSGVAVASGSSVSKALIVAINFSLAFEREPSDKSTVTASGNSQAEIDINNTEITIKNNPYFFNVNLPGQV